MANIHSSQGALLIGTYINLILYTFELVCVYIYFTSKRSRNDPKIIKGAVIVAACFDTIGTVGTLATCYLLSVNYSWRDVLIQPPLWSLSIWLICNALVALIVHIFMNRRLFLLSRGFVVCGIIFIFTVVAFTFAILVAGITLAKSRTLSTRYRDTFMVATSLGTGLLTDVCITVALLWQLRSSRMHTRSTQRLVRKISSVAITTGSITTSISLAELIAFVAKPDARISTAVGFILGRAYSLTMLFTLNYRSRILETSDLETSVLPLEMNSACESARSSPVPVSLPAPVRLRPSFNGHLGS